MTEEPKRTEQDEVATGAEARPQSGSGSEPPETNAARLLSPDRVDASWEDPFVGEQPKPRSRGRSRRWGRRLLLGAATLLVLLVAGAGTAAWWYLRVTPAQRTGGRITPSRAVARPPAAAPAPVPSVPERAGTPAPGPAPASKRETRGQASQSPSPVLSLEEDTDRRARISEAVKQAVASWNENSNAWRSPAQPKLDTSLPAQPRLDPLEPGEAADLGPFLSQYFYPPEAWGLSVPRLPTRVRVGDLDGDGEGELVFADFDGRRVLVYDREPDGGYALVAIEATDGWPQNVVLADLDNDGWEDILVPGGSSRTSLLLNRHGWEFEYRMIFIKWAAGYWTQAVDLNGDGALDMLAGNQMGAIAYLNDGAGTLVRGQRLVDRHTVAELVVADVTGDGVRDVVTTPWLDWNNPPDAMPITVAEMSRLGVPVGRPRTFAYPGPLWRLLAIDRTHAPARDLIAAVARSNEVVLFANAGDGTFTTEVLGKATRAGTMLVTDVNGDGWDDVIAGARVFVNEDGTLTPRARFPGGLQPIRWELARVNADPFPDLVLVDNSGPQLLIYYAQPPGPDVPAPIRAGDVGP